MVRTIGGMNTQTPPQAYTKNEMRDMLMEHIRFLAHYWATQVEAGRTVQERIDGFAHSLLTTMDGCSGSFPCAIDLVLRPNADDKAFHIAEGERWVEDGMVINDDCHLHSLLFVKEGASYAP